jgi:hypothetical protein
VAGRLWQIYCDESCTEKGHEHMVLGGIMLPIDLSEHINKKVDEWRAATHEKGELKWVKVTKKKYPMYSGVARATLARIRASEMSFKSTIIPQREIDYKKFHNNDEELGLAKLTYQFLYHSS